MSAPSSAPPAPAVAFAGPLAHLGAVVLATARSFVKRSNAYWIDVIRWPLFPLIYFATMRLTYAAAGQDTVAGANVAGFLLVGMFGFIIWSGTIWSGGYAVEYERAEGTIGALFLSPASRAAVIAGYGLGGFVWMLPAFVVVTILGVAVGARFNVAEPLAVAGAVLALLIASLATGFAFAGLFVLSRRANLLANFVQLPGQLLAGFLFPRASLPEPLYALSNAVPAGHAIDALRASALGAATLRDTLPALALALGVSALYALVGLLSLRKVEHAA
ncbi:MAG: ABC transporter permease, partial [Chloroflexota bacterium]|nr:ABC transporter permease [Chloroflexota bacterium]